jgi:hypothetical protein
VVLVTVSLVPTTTTLMAAPTSAVSGTNVTFTAAVAGAAGTGSPTGTVTFSNGATVLGMATLSSGTATYSTAALAVGTASVTAAYGGSSTFAASTSSAVAVVSTAPPPPDFGVAASPASGTVAQGQSATTTLTVTPANGFNSAVSFACTGLPSEAACSFNPTSVTPSGTAAATTTVTVTTTAASAALQHSGFKSSGPLFALVLPGVGALLGLGRFGRRLRSRFRWMTVALLSVALACGLGACGSSGSMGPKNPGTPAGTSTVTITATSGTNSHTATYALTVSQ